jgi:hypothetical protein
VRKNKGKSLEHPGGRSLEQAWRTTKLQGKLPSSLLWYFLGFRQADFCSNAASLKVTMKRNSAPRCCVLLF